MLSSISFSLWHLRSISVKWSTNGSQCVITIVDNFTRFTWVYLMQNKSQTRTIYYSIFNSLDWLIATQFNVKIKCLRSDNGEEFNMVDFYSFKMHVSPVTMVAAST